MEFLPNYAKKLLPTATLRTLVGKDLMKTIVVASVVISHRCNDSHILHAHIGKKERKEILRNILPL